MEILSNIANMGLGVLGNVLKRIMGFSMTIITAVLRGIAAVAVGLTGLAAGVITTFSVAMVTATKAASDYATRVNRLRLNTGMDIGQAGAMAQRWGAFGVKPDDLGGAFGGRPLQITNMIARMFGFNVGGANDITSFNQAYRRNMDGSVFGFYRNQAMLKATGMDSDQFRFIGSLSPDKIRDQQAFAEKTASSLGVGPETLAKMSEELPLAMAKLQLFFQLLVVKFAQGALPFVMEVLERVIKFLQDNGPQIAETIKNIFRWIYADLPPLLVKAATWMVNAMDGIVDAFVRVIRAGAVMVESLGQADEGLGYFVGSVLLSIDMLTVAFQGLIKGLAAIGFVVGHVLTFIVQLTSFIPYLIQKLIKAVFDKITIPVLRKIGLDGVADFLEERSTTTVGVMEEMQKFRMPTWDLLMKGLPGTTDLYGAWENKQNSGDFKKISDKMFGFADNVQTTKDGWQDTALGFLGNLEKDLGTADERRTAFDKQMEVLNRVEKNTAATADNTAATADGINGFRSGTIERVLAYIAEDAYLAVAGV